MYYKIYVAVYTFLRKKEKLSPERITIPARIRRFGSVNQG